MDFVEFFVNGVIIMILIHVGLNMLAWMIKRRVDSDLEEVSQDLELERLIPLTVEVVDNQYFCYNSITQDFVCQGVNLVEIVKKFKQRYPEKSAAIYNGDETAVRTLKSQLLSLIHI